MESFDHNGPVITEFMALAEGDMLPREGASSFFYHHSADGETYVLADGGEFHFFYLHHDDVIQSVLAGGGNWDLHRDGSRLLVTLIVGTIADPYTIMFIVDRAHERSRLIAGYMIAGGGITVNYLNLLYGGIVKERGIRYDIPAKQLDAMRAYLAGD